MRKDTLVALIFLMALPIGCDTEEGETRRFPTPIGAVCLTPAQLQHNHLRKLLEALLLQHPQEEIFYKVYTLCDPPQLPFGPPDAPGAYLFQIRSNAFYVIDDQTGPPVWHVLQGDNVLIDAAEKSISGLSGDLQVQFGYQQMTTSGTKLSQRHLSMVVHGLSELQYDEVKSLVDYYVNLLPYPKRLYLDLEDNYPSACRRALVRYGWMGSRVGLCDSEWFDDENPTGQYAVRVQTEVLPKLRIYQDGELVHEEVYEAP